MNKKETAAEDLVNTRRTEGEEMGIIQWIQEEGTRGRGVRLHEVEGHASSVIQTRSSPNGPPPAPLGER